MTRVTALIFIAMQALVFVVAYGFLMRNTDTINHIAVNTYNSRDDVLLVTIALISIIGPVFIIR